MPKGVKQHPCHPRPENDQNTKRDNPISPRLGRPAWIVMYLDARLPRASLEAQLLLGLPFSRYRRQLGAGNRTAIV